MDLNSNRGCATINWIIRVEQSGNRYLTKMGAFIGLDVRLPD